MKLDSKLLNRNLLTKEQQDFLGKIIPWSLFIQEQTKLKAIEFKGIPSRGMFPSVIMSELILESGWGSHPLSKEKIKSKYANNLSLMEVTPGWDGRKLKFNDKEYKLFDTWEQFAIHYSDYIVFSNWFSNLLKSTDPEEQLAIYSLHKPNYLVYNREASEIILSYNLGYCNNVKF